ncbi:MAG: DUF370 domain-containing protein [Chloroflexi bacterium]|nr:DUF370 domain-containing protein [Chloroflexota bacterium]
MNDVWLKILNEGVITTSRVVAVGLVEAAPIRRLIQATPPSHVVVLTGGHKRQTAVVLDSGHVAITALSLSELTALLENS